MSRLSRPKSLVRAARKRSARRRLTTEHSPADLLAVGLEKGRGESVLVYDVHRTAASNSRDQSGARHGGLHREPSQHSRGRASSPAASNTSAHESAPLLTFGVSDFVTSLSFLPSGPGGQTSGALLATAAAGKWIRVFDLRSPPATVTTWTSRAGYGLAPNPYNAQQLSSFGEDGICRLWDLRKPLDPLLSFSEADAGAIPLQTVTNSAPRPLAETAWCPNRPGTFATLEKESSTIRLWSLVDGPGPRLLYSHTESRTNDRYIDHNNANEALRMPILLEDRQSEFRLSRSLCAFGSLRSVHPFPQLACFSTRSSRSLLLRHHRSHLPPLNSLDSRGTRAVQGQVRSDSRLCRYRTPRSPTFRNAACSSPTDSAALTRTPYRRQRRAKPKMPPTCAMSSAVERLRARLARHPERQRSTSLSVRQIAAELSLSAVSRHPASTGTKPLGRRPSCSDKTRPPISFKEAVAVVVVVVAPPRLTNPVCTTSARIFPSSCVSVSRRVTARTRWSTRI